MFFLNFFLPAALLSNQRGFWKSKNIPIFAIYGYNVSQSMSSGHTLRMYSFLEGYWNCALASSFFLILRKAAPSLSFWTKIGLSFCPKGKFWVFLALEFSQKCWKKSLQYCPKWDGRGGNRCLFVDNLVHRPLTSRSYDQRIQLPSWGKKMFITDHFKNKNENASLPSSQTTYAYTCAVPDTMEMMLVSVKVGTMREDSVLLLCG